MPDSEEPTTRQQPATPGPPPDPRPGAPGGQHERAPVPLWPPPPPEAQSPRAPAQPPWTPPAPPRSTASPSPTGTRFGFGYTHPNPPLDPIGRPLASWFKRALAILVDFFLLSFVLNWFGHVVFPQVLDQSTPPTGDLFAFFGVTVLLWLLYLSFFGSSRRGQTIGMMLYGIAVRDEKDGGAVPVGRAALRGLVFIVMLWTVIDIIWPLWDLRRQSLHDKAGRTVVVDVRLAAFLQQSRLGGR